MREKRLYKDAGKHLAQDDKLLPAINTHWTTLKFKAAHDFIAESKRKEIPFFLNLWLDAPHAPYEASEQGIMDKYNERTTGQDLLYRAMVSQLDKGIGAILDQLNTLGIAENTLVIFTSDNGPAYLGSSAHFKGRKTDFHEGGIRVPMIAWWPRQIKKGTETNEITNTIDLMPTFASIANVAISKENKVDGIDIKGLFLESRALNDRTMFWEIAERYKNSGNYVNVTDIRIQPAPNQIVRKRKWKLLALEGKPLELYNIDEDPYERWNIIKQYPEITENLIKELQTWLSEPRQPKPY